MVSALAAFLFAAACHLALHDGKFWFPESAQDVGVLFALSAVSSIFGGFRVADEAGWIAGAAIAIGPRPRGWTRRVLGSGRRKLVLASCAAAGAIAAAAAAGTFAAWAGAALFVFCDLGAAIHFSGGEAEGFASMQDLVS